MIRIDPEEMRKEKNAVGLCGNPDCLETKLPFCDDHKPLDATPLPAGTVEHEAVGIMNRDQLDALVPMGLNYFSFLNMCHPHSGLRLAYFKETGSVAGACMKCNQPVVALQIAKKE